MNRAAFVYISLACWCAALTPVWCGVANPAIDTGILQRKPLASQELLTGPLTTYTRIKRQEATAEQQPTQQSSNSNLASNDAIIKLQDFLLQAKAACATELGFSAEAVSQKSLLYELNPTRQEKCLMECVLRRTELMRRDNRLSVERIASIAGMISGRNPLVMSIAAATAEHCNRFINAPDACDAAYQINQCIANEMKARKVKIFY